MNPEQARITLRNADCLFSRDAVEIAIDRLAERTATALKDRNPLVLGVMNGGIVLLGGLLTRWSFPMQVDYLHATRYRGEISVASNSTGWPALRRRCGGAP